MQLRTRRRLATIVLTPVAALAMWALIRLAGIDLVLSHGHEGDVVGPADVFGAALLAALAAWPVVHLIERHGKRPLRLWAQVGSTALALSIIGPSRLADGTSAVALMSLHIVTAATVVVGYSRTLRACSVDCAERAACAPRSVRDVRA